jgi:predicted nucleic acid-binding protein
VDCIIAAICIEHGLTLLHRDSDFDLIQECVGLRCLAV